MSEMVGRVARAIHKAENPEGSYEGFRDHTTDGEIFERMARAAIEAMREPTDEMIKNGEDVRTYDGVEEMDSYGHPKSVWRAMIGAALGRVDA